MTLSIFSRSLIIGKAWLHEALRRSTLALGIYACFLFALSLYCTLRVLYYKFELLHTVHGGSPGLWGGCNPLNPPSRSAPEHAVVGARQSGDVLLQYLHDYTVVDGSPVISASESLPNLQGNVVFESES